MELGLWGENVCVHAGTLSRTGRVHVFTSMCVCQVEHTARRGCMCTCACAHWQTHTGPECLSEGRCVPRSQHSQEAAAPHSRRPAASVCPVRSLGRGTQREKLKATSPPGWGSRGAPVVVLTHLRGIRKGTAPDLSGPGLPPWSMRCQHAPRGLQGKLEHRKYGACLPEDMATKARRLFLTPSSWHLLGHGEPNLFPVLSPGLASGAAPFPSQLFRDFHYQGFALSPRTGRSQGDGEFAVLARGLLAQDDPSALD